MHFNQTHGHSTGGRVPKTYESWRNMWKRCTSRSHAQYSSYGGRGITVCTRWKKFENFLAEWSVRDAVMRPLRGAS